MDAAGLGLKTSLGSSALTQLSLFLFSSAGLTSQVTGQHNECFLNVTCRQPHWLIVLFTIDENFLLELPILSKNSSQQAIFFSRKVFQKFQILEIGRYSLKCSFPVGNVGNFQQNILVQIIEIIAENHFLKQEKHFYHTPTFIPLKPMSILILKREDLFLLL